MKKLVIAFAVAVTAAAAIAAPHARTAHRGNRGARFQKFAEKLNLSDAQKQQMREIRQADRQRNQQLYADFRTKLRAFREARRAGDPNADALKAELEPLRDQIQAARKAAHESILNVLTPEQRQQLRSAAAKPPLSERR